jgi:hypothetical protein
MANDKLIRLVQLISQKTESGELKWEETAQENTFQVAFPKYVVQIALIPDEQMYATYSLRILNDRNVVIEEVTPDSLNPYEPKSYEDSKRIFRELYEAARRQALGVEQALDTLLQKLQE